MKKTYYGDSFLFRLSLYRPLQESGEAGQLITSLAGILSKYQWELENEIIRPLFYNPHEARKAKKLQVKSMDPVLMVRPGYKK